jgi:hypothetical protein
MAEPGRRVSWPDARRPNTEPNTTSPTEVNTPPRWASFLGPTYLGYPSRRSP